VVCQIIERTDANTLNRFVRNVVGDKVDLVATDEHLGYDRLTVFGCPRKAVTHSAGEYMCGEIHANYIESFWSLLKRGIIGTYHHVSKSICRSTSWSFNSVTTTAAKPIFSARRTNWRTLQSKPTDAGK
jgi:hypothetical protein